jgi:acyl phosphate:glycerol-3-phosphate acyltransferase
MTDAFSAALIAYAVGCVCAGYYVVRLVAADDIRRWGSGAAGATNVGRRFGAGGFAVTFVLDYAKGAAVSWAAMHAGLDDVTVGSTIAAVVIGHIWPVQLQWRGGKGIATSLGAFAVYDLRIVAVIGILFAMWLVVLRAFVLSGVLAYVLAPLLLIHLGVPADRLVTVGAVAAVVLVAHRADLRTAFAGWNHRST